jgi:predicted membrane protein
MKTQYASISFFGLFFWIIVNTLFFAVFFLMHLPPWTIGFAPLFFIVYILMLKTTKYQFSDNEITIKSPFESTQIIQTKNIKHYRVKETNYLRQLFGVPPFITFLKLKQGSVELFTINRNVINSLDNYLTSSKIKDSIK